MVHLLVDRQTMKSMSANFCMRSLFGVTHMIFQGLDPVQLAGQLRKNPVKGFVDHFCRPLPNSREKNCICIGSMRAFMKVSRSDRSTANQLEGSV